jgi:hypothetical protein
MNAVWAEQEAAAEAGADPQVQQQFLWTRPGDRPAVESPARRLQVQLSESMAEPQIERWSARRSLLVVFATNVVLWTAVVAGVRAML